ncbi:hypothetical protein GCM10009802_34990 [Streptomyces synnematoformans]|uniref:Uncharacterized protein n=1 Tax=Streptomyces synnematoformans TaxID=415721 RepID=A0ABN2YIV0_9ACTN
MIGSMQAAEASSPRTTPGHVPCADALRTTSGLGLDVLDRLRRACVPLGLVAVISARQAVEFVVSAGTAGPWPALPGTTCVPACRTRWPAPGSVTGRRWLVAPGACSVRWTDPDALCVAVGAALLRRAVVPVAAGQVCS